jgi:hypothetical protein
MDFDEFYACFAGGHSAVVVRFFGDIFDEVSSSHRIRSNWFQHSQAAPSGVRNVSFGCVRFQQRFGIVGSQHIDLCALHGPVAVFCNGHGSTDVGLWHDGAYDKRIVGLLLAIRSSAVDALDWGDDVCGWQF